MNRKLLENIKFAMILMLLSGLFACKKECTSYPVKQYAEFQYEGLAQISANRMFTKTGEINNAALVNRYSNEYAQYFYTANSAYNGNAYKSFSFVNDDSVFNMGTVPVGELKRTSQGIYDLFTSKSFFPVNDTNSINLHLGKYKFFTPVTTPLGYTYLSVNEGAVILKKAGDSVNVPMVRYILTSIGDNQVSFAADRFNNVFDETGIAKLGTKDTLLIQSFNVVLKRK